MSSTLPSFKMRAGLMLKLSIACSVCLSQPALAGWKINVLPADDQISPGRAVIVFESDRGSPTFKDALQELAQSGRVKRLETITLHSFVDDSSFQQQVFTELQRIAPRALAEAKRSLILGKTPKIMALRKVLDEAVVKTPTVKSIDSELATVGLHVSGSIHEKLTLNAENGQPRLKCFLWLSVAPTKRP